MSVTAIGHNAYYVWGRLTTAEKRSGLGARLLPASSLLSFADKGLQLRCPMLCT